jgi:enoyl-CoA hydratase/carnithine racemase
MEMIVSGRHLPATEAKKLGIIDAIVEGGGVRKEAIAMMTGPRATLRERTSAAVSQ